jgi:hypothetical protein
VQAAKIITVGLQKGGWMIVASAYSGQQVELPRAREQGWALQEVRYYLA